MSAAFVDTSALLALLVEEDQNHADAVRVFSRLRAARSRLVTSSYVLVETYALLGRRVEKDAVQRFREGFEPLLDLVWVDAAWHQRALDDLLRRPRGVSLVDATSFVVAEALGLDRAFTYDRHFVQAGMERLR